MQIQRLSIYIYATCLTVFDYVQTLYAKNVYTSYAASSCAKRVRLCVKILSPSNIIIILLLLLLVFCDRLGQVTRPARSFCRSRITFSGQLYVRKYIVTPKINSPRSGCWTRSDRVLGSLELACASRESVHPCTSPRGVAFRSQINSEVCRSFPSYYVHHLSIRIRVHNNTLSTVSARRFSNADVQLCWPRGGKVFGIVSVETRALTAVTAPCLLQRR